MVTEFIKALIIGFCASAPLGPLGLLCIQKTLSKGRLSGLSIGIGASIFDTLSSVLAIFSLSVVYDFVEQNKSVVTIVGGIIILLIGISVTFKNPFDKARQPKNPSPSHHIQEVLQGFAMTASNPGAIVLMLGLFALVNLDPSSFTSATSMIVMVTGVLVGTLLWWFILSGVISLFRGKFQIRQILFFNRVSGLVIAGFGIFAIVSGILLKIAALR